MSTCKTITFDEEGRSRPLFWMAGRPVGLEKLTLRLTQPSLAGVGAGAELGNVMLQINDLGHFSLAKKWGF